jgi:hypothetical protein
VPGPTESGIRRDRLARPGRRPRGRRRPTGGERPTTNQHQPTRNDSKRQGQRRSPRIAAGQEMAMLAFTRQRSLPWLASQCGRTGAPEASATGRDRSPPVHGGYTRSRQVGDCNGHQRSSRELRNRRSNRERSRHQAALQEAGRVRVSHSTAPQACDPCPCSSGHPEPHQTVETEPLPSRPPPNASSQKDVTLCRCAPCRSEAT